MAKIIRSDGRPTGPMTIEEFAAYATQMQAELQAKWDAKKDIKLGDMLVPQLGNVPFRDIFSWRMDKENRVFLRLFPMFEVNVPEGKGVAFAHAHNSVNFLIDAFGRQQYETLKIDEHIRLFDPTKPNERAVRTVQKTDPGNGDTYWVRYSWTGNGWRSNSPRKGSEEYAGWVAKHRLINEALMSIARKLPLDVWFFDREGQPNISLDNAKRVLDDRLDMTLAEVAVARADDWVIAHAIGQAQRNPTTAPASVPTVVGNITSKRVITLVSPHDGSRPFSREYDPADPVQVKWLSALIDDGYTLK